MDEGKKVQVFLLRASVQMRRLYSAHVARSMPKACCLCSPHSRCAADAIVQTLVLVPIVPSDVTLLLSDEEGTIVEVSSS